jgi:integrase
MYGGRNIETYDLFDRWMQTRGLAATTRKRRRTSISGFTRWIAPLELTAVEADHVESWLATFTSKRTRHAYRSDLAAFYDWAVRRRVVTANPMLEVDRIRQPKSIPRPVPSDLVTAIINACECGRLRMALMLAAYAGLRRAEICALTADDIRLHPSRPTLIVRGGKGDKDRIVPLHPRLVRSLTARKPRGRLIPWQPDTLGRLAAEHMRSLGYDYTIHQLRGACATELARVLHGDVVRIGRFLGHESPITTMGYIGYMDDTVTEQLPGLYDEAG